MALPPPANAAEVSSKLFLPPVRPYRDTKIPSGTTLHMANRFSYGYSPALRREIKAAGGAQAWFNDQLDPASIADAQADMFDGWFPTRYRTASQHFARAKAGSGYVPSVTGNHARWTLLRRAYSQRQVHEAMSEFWLNHLHVYSGADLTWMWRTDYDDVIRSHALGRFDEMLRAAIVHPCMLTYLDGDLSVVDAINENLGRELLELHTVGRGADYGEAAVRDSARLLTGYRIDRFRTWETTYEPTLHATGSVNVLGFSDPNNSTDGRNALRAYLDYLAHHDATAQRIARKLAVRFVSDQPSAALIDHLASVFQESGTDIKATLKALVGHSEFAASAGKKVRTPTEDLVATLRAYGVQMEQPVRDGDAANALLYLSKSAGQEPFGWGPPDGFPDNGAAWSSAARMMSSFHLHYGLAGHWFPDTGVQYRSHASWLPQRKIRFDEFVDHLCRQIHGRPSTSLVLGAASIATNLSPADVITKDHVLINFRMPKLFGILLDTPQFLTR